MENFGRQLMARLASDRRSPWMVRSRCGAVDDSLVTRAGIATAGASETRAISPGALPVRKVTGASRLPINTAVIGAEFQHVRLERQPLVRQPLVGEHPPGLLWNGRLLARSPTERQQYPRQRMELGVNEAGGGR